VKKLISLILSLILLLSCYTIHTYDGRKTNRFFFNPSVKREYCKDKETVLENAEYFYRKVYGRDKDYHMFKIMVREDSCCFHLNYYRSYPDVEGFIQIRDGNQREITLSKEKYKIVNWH